MARKPRLRLVAEAGDGDASSTGEDRPIVNLVQGRRGEAVDAVIGRLAERRPNLYQRDGRIVHVIEEQREIGPDTKVPILLIREVGPEWLRTEITRACDIRKFDRRS